VIERIFGVIKRKYKILNTPPEYSIDTQSDLILGIAALHNFCRGLDGSKVDDYITELEGEIEDNEDTIIVDQGASIRDSESRAMELKRDQIAEKMWLDYQGYINNNTNK
jgi:hypothetical protein